MMKPGIGAYDRFKQLFDQYSKEAGKEQYLIPYFISAHPGTTDRDMLNLAIWLKSNNFRLDQVQAFLRYHAPENWPLLRDALKKMGRADLIGNGKRYLVPSWQPAGKQRSSLNAGQRKTIHPHYCPVNYFMGVAKPLS